MPFVGLNIGALTVEAVTLRGDEVVARVVRHQGRPRAVPDTPTSDCLAPEAGTW